MSRRFMITKSAPCCGNTGAIGEVYEFEGYHDKEYGTCICGSQYKGKILLCRNGEYGVQEFRVKWLPPESDIIEHDTIQEIEDKLKV
jgi:hypothetical protein